MTVLLLGESVNGQLATDTVARALDALKPLGEVHLLLVGDVTENAASTAAHLEGVTKVLIARNNALEHGLAEPVAALIVGLAPHYSHIAAGATAFSKNVLPRVAALLDVMVLTDVTAVQDAETFERPVFAGNVIQTVKSTDKIKVFTIRTSVFSAVAQTEAALIETLDEETLPCLSQWVEDQSVISERPELTSARVVVSGGRGIGSRENFECIISLADKMGGAVGASRAAVDLGYAPNDWQVGQTGKVVAPDLYIAAGISGAIQHLAGMKDSKVIVAINKDEEAPIFGIADYGIVGDLFTVLPELTQKL
ncbi:electron transfer flavoprotein subunit alpha [Acetobacter tropicalis]|uniref:Electron transfer flavoprotein subunit alpha n=1 Tax=Acetobacter tropicalis TaxID=104102 RepID=A0A094ZEG4_9PROT|nr:FAD-binding protein [Acetobacter tropicalis]KAA8383552.1 electron transfer flavoprotein subunit alpha [Acetobacter tropicalis]KAA8389335.1 electron transfer flavoprotein subunit alpha [Acetobacter tropicalis]KGB21026.1 Electron transfer flavoprotein, alpha subunit [Acetobacter tropicalis]MBC9008671.1 electron transfer flavoprotein subunit alpha [Acetobacter tropicalis]MDO8173044.1 FAD-binding protein [Acetobacter tropicalis]